MASHKLTNNTDALLDLGTYYAELPDEAKAPKEYKERAYNIRKKKHDGDKVFCVVLGAKADRGNKEGRREPDMLVPEWVYRQILENRAAASFLGNQVTSTFVA